MQGYLELYLLASFNAKNSRPFNEGVKRYIKFHMLKKNSFDVQKRYKQAFCNFNKNY